MRLVLLGAAFLGGGPALVVALTGADQVHSHGVDARRTMRGAALVSLDQSMGRKNSVGREGYLVRTAGEDPAPTPPTNYGNSVQKPLGSVDHTVAVPPDADENVHTQPIWGVNTPAPDHVP
eukprot:CAMPEP_0117536912 /NCGR_PEP_ID=MMETSP0784-20121206/41695_1 /TAXON_ID=39447 /ORGANISM="" /LENGTH=120 /DNA_ID=CAMNT_0005333485 /DNA_START=45 /DNA_END=407 /DNA_ORIENTATION=+